MEASRGQRPSIHDALMMLPLHIVAVEQQLLGVVKEVKDLGRLFSWCVAIVINYHLDVVKEKRTGKGGCNTKI